MPAQEYYWQHPEKYRAAALQHYSKNKETILETARVRYAVNPEPARQRSKEWVKGNPEAHAKHGLETRRRKNGFSPALFSQRLAQQAGKCAICKVILGRGLAATSACADHCHETNTPRGVLCKRCNLLLGHAKDSVDALHGAIEYLNSWKRTA
jgi:hypothetical protein